MRIFHSGGRPVLNDEHSERYSNRPFKRVFRAQMKARKHLAPRVTVAGPPEQGQLVSVRSRHWMVNDVRPSTLPAAALKPTFSGPQHLLTLASVEDDGLGEELQVIWEIEPGAKVIEKVALPEPTGFDPPDQFDAFLDAVRWGAASTADVRNIQAPFRSGVAAHGEAFPG